MKILCLLLWITNAPARAEDLSFQQALQMMIEQHVDVLVQKTKVAIAKEQVRAGYGLFSPKVNLQAQRQNGGGTNAITVGSDVVGSSDTYSAQATWNVFRFGADAATLSSAKRDRESQQANLNNNYILAEDKAARALLNLIETRMEVDALRRSEESFKHFLEIAQARFNRSLLSREEAEKVAVDAANAEARRADAELRLFDAQATVSSLLGHSQVKLEWPWEARLSDTKTQSLLDPAQSENAAKIRPDYQAAQAAVLAEEAHGSALFRSLLPSIDLSYNLSNTYIQGQKLPGWSTMATLTLPVWNGYRDQADYRIQVQNQYAAQYRLQQLEREIRATIESAQKNFRLSQQQFQSRMKNFKTAEHILAQDEARFKIGRADANDVNLDLTRVTEAETLAVQSVRQAHVSYLQLIHAFGQRLASH